ncbi:hypothetical protein F511_15969 [Dorcoceras hygrometricum]|uniref:Uncharacterized protein n=1 Tax=Dorcoceras hygrometricum TaxID=472368 RepID=A0A2Z7BQ22_9LAMI|nr:hypothetical protein F511_15969 [Dorcoceras hygrometricum]
MKTLTILQRITLSHTTKLFPWTQRKPNLHHNRSELPLPRPRTWRVHSGAKGFTGQSTPDTRQPKNRESPSRKGNTGRKEESRKGYEEEDNDDKIPDIVWKRMISRILTYVGVPLLTGFALLQAFSIIKEQNLWDVPIWLPYLTTFITFGASALGIAFGSLSTSLEPDEEGSILGLEQVQKNWTEMWKEEDESGER